MKCPSCNSENVVQSRRKGYERYLRFLSMRDPYRCKECWVRFWKFRPPFRSGLSKALLTILILLCLAVYLAPEIRERFFPQGPVTKPLGKKPALGRPVQPKPEPVPAAPTEPPGQPTPPASPDMAPSAAETPADEASWIAISDIEVKEAAKPPETGAADQGADAAEQGPPAGEETADAQADAPPRKKPAPAQETPASKPADAAPGKRTLSAISHARSGDEFKVTLSAGGPIDQYDSFYEEKPLRLILDLAGAWEFPGKPVIKADGNVVKQIRIGEHPDRLRVVLDMKSGVSWGHAFARSPEGLVLIIKKKTFGGAVD